MIIIEWMASWYSWWMDFWAANPTLFVASALFAIGFSVFVRWMKKRR